MMNRLTVSVPALPVKDGRSVSASPLWVRSEIALSEVTDLGCSCRPGALTGHWPRRVRVPGLQIERELSIYA